MHLLNSIDVLFSLPNFSCVWPGWLINFVLKRQYWDQKWLFLTLTSYILFLNKRSSNWLRFLLEADFLWQIVTNLPNMTCSRAFGILIIDDNEKAWFPAPDLKEFHGIVDHQVTAAETLLFCIREDGSEGFCCPTGNSEDEDDS